MALAKRRCHGMSALARIGLFLAGLVLAGAVLSVGSGVARAASPGVVPDLTWYISDEDKRRSAEALQDLGSEWVRLHVQWKDAELERGTLNEWWMSEYAEAIDMSRAAGQKVIVMVSEAPSWASGSTSSNVPKSNADFASFMSRFAERFAGRVDAYEIWNEPNLKRFWSTGPSAAAYTAMLKAAYPAVKAADPAAKVVFAGLSTNDYTFLSGAYQAGVKGYFDVLATHPYPYCGSTSPAEIRRTSSGRITADSFLGYRELREVMVARGDAKPIWFTEFGWNTSSAECSPGSGQWQGGVSGAKQAQYLNDAYRLIESDPYVEVALWYALRNNYWAKDADEPEAQFGLLRTDYSPKPAYDAFKAYASGAETAPAPTPIETQTTLAVTGKKKRGPRARGTVLRARGGVVQLIAERRRDGGWVVARQVRVRVSSDGRYRRRMSLPTGRFRLYAKFSGSDLYRSSRSPYRRLRVR